PGRRRPRAPTGQCRHQLRLPAPERDPPGPGLDGARVVPGLCRADRQRHSGRGVTNVSLLEGRESAVQGLTDTGGYQILAGIGYRSVSTEAPMNDLKTSAPSAITPIGKREAQAWLVKQLGYERLLASLRKAYAEKQVHQPERDVAACTGKQT